MTRPALRYHGGKWLLAAWIISHFPRHRVYTEVFGGAASVLLQKPRSYAEVYNDAWDTVVNVFRVLRDPVAAAELRRRIELTPFARTEFDGCGEAQIRECDDPIEKARLTIFRSFAGFGSASTNAEYATGFRGGGNTEAITRVAKEWSTYPKQIESYVERLRGVVIENRDYRSVITANDSPDALHYVDPPYVHATRNMQRGNAAYVHEFTDDDHRQLSAVLHSLSGMVVLSGYDCELYRDLFGGWEVRRKETHGDGATDRIECLWLNPLCAARQKQLKLFP